MKKVMYLLWGNFFTLAAMELAESESTPKKFVTFFCAEELIDGVIQEQKELVERELAKKIVNASLVLKVTMEDNGAPVRGLSKSDNNNIFKDDALQISLGSMDEVNIQAIPKERFNHVLSYFKDGAQTAQILVNESDEKIIDLLNTTFYLEMNTLKLKLADEIVCRWTSHAFCQSFAENYKRVMKYKPHKEVEQEIAHKMNQVLIEKIKNTISIGKKYYYYPAKILNASIAHGELLASCFNHKIYLDSCKSTQEENKQNAYKKEAFYKSKETIYALAINPRDKKNEVAIGSYDGNLYLLNHALKTIRKKILKI